MPCFHLIEVYLLKKKQGFFIFRQHDISCCHGLLHHHYLPGLQWCAFPKYQKNPLKAWEKLINHLALPFLHHTELLLSPTFVFGILWFGSLFGFNIPVHIGPLLLLGARE